MRVCEVACQSVDPSQPFTITGKFEREDGKLEDRFLELGRLLNALGVSEFGFYSWTDMA